MNLGVKSKEAAANGLYAMLASVAHDIRTPLCSILGFLELIKEEPDESVRRQFLSNMEICGRALRELVDDLLDLAKLDAGKLNFKPVFCDAKALVLSVARSFDAALVGKDVGLRCNFSDLPLLELDMRRFTQVLFNLIGNAVKFTDRGSVAVRLTFSPSDAKTGRLRLSVKDTGIGISRRDLKRLAQPYARALTGDRGGTGLGLLICKRIVESVGGRIDVASVLGKGSVFTVILPKVGFKRAVRSVKKAVQAKPVKFSSLKILVVDDFEMNRAVLAAACKQLGVGTVLSASSGQEALCRLEHSRNVDLVLTDVKMRDIDGRRLAQLVRSNPATKRVPIYFVTADTEAVGYAAPSGADGCLIKPVSKELLRQVLSSVKRRKSHA